MCGRYTILFTWEEIWRLSTPFWQPLPPLSPRYNVAPKSGVPIIRPFEADDGPKPGGSMARWWLIPRWSRTPDSPFTTFNARSEDAHTKRSFKASFRDRRCVVPASGFYEWKLVDDAGPKPVKQPMYITRADGGPLFFAGLWDLWGDKSMEQIESCTVLTTAPNAEMTPVHDRMPCVLEPEEIEAWIDPDLDVEGARAMLAPAADGVLTMHPVGRAVGNVRNDGPGLILPADTSRGDHPNNKQGPEDRGLLF